jgi:hypothetical protein
VALAWQKQTLHILAKSFALIALCEEGIKVPGVGFQRLWGRDDSSSFRHLTFLLSLYFTTLGPSSTNYRYSGVQKD